MPFLKNHKCQTISISRHCQEISKLNGLRPIFFYPGDGCYRGNWKNNKRDGHGNKAQKNQLIYDGDWHDNLRHGTGTIRKRSSSSGHMERVYIGGFKNDQKSGEGKKFYKNGTYFGQWQGDLRSGLGIMWYKSGAIYLGEWQYDKYHGVGVLYHKNGNRYEGWFADGLKDGEGIFFHNTHGQIQKGMWVKNICKSSIMFDQFRNQATEPTPYPIQKSQLHEPDEFVSNLFREYLPTIQIESDSLLGLPCFEMIKKIKKRFQNLKIEASIPN